MLLLHLSVIVAIVPLISGHNSPSRHKRDALEHAKEVGLNIGGIILDKINDGAALKLNQETGLTFFDNKFNTGHMSRIGFGDALRDTVEDEDDERKKRSALEFVNRIKRSPCGRKNKSTTPPTDTEP